MKKTSLLIIFSFLIATIGVFVYFNCFQKKVEIGDALVKVEDLSVNGFNINQQIINRTDNYDMQSTNSASITGTSTSMQSFISADHAKTEYGILLISSIEKFYVGENAKFWFNKSQSFLLEQNVYEWKVTEEFVPEFKNSTYFQYKQCMIVSSQYIQPNPRYLHTYRCIVSSIINDNYLFTLEMSGDGKIEKESINYLLGIALDNKHKIFEKLP